MKNKKVEIYLFILQKKRAQVTIKLNAQYLIHVY